jgi:hypothetical protein
MTPTDSTGPVPVQRRPDAPTADELRHELETAYGVMLHRQHLAEGYADSGDAHSRDHWRAVAQTHRADAEAVAQVLGIAS